MKTKFKNNEILKDSVSGYEGVVIGVCVYATGCIQYEVKARGLDKEGQPHKSHWFDESRLERVKRAKAVKGKKAKDNPGGPQHHLS